MVMDSEESGFFKTQLPRQAGQAFWGANKTTIALLKGINSLERRHLQIIFCLEAHAVYYFDENAIDISDDITVVRPVDIASDATAGRWKILFSEYGYHIQSTPPDSVEGTMWYDTVNKQWRGYNGTDWNTILG